MDTTFRILTILTVFRLQLLQEELQPELLDLTQLKLLFLLYQQQVLSLIQTIAQGLISHMCLVRLLQVVQ